MNECIELAQVATDAMDVMSEAITNGLQIGDADWAQMIKCKDAISSALFNLLEADDARTT